MNHPNEISNELRASHSCYSFETESYIIKHAIILEVSKQFPKSTLTLKKYMNTSDTDFLYEIYVYNLKAQIDNQAEP